MGEHNVTISLFYSCKCWKQPNHNLQSSALKGQSQTVTNLLAPCKTPTFQYFETLKQIIRNMVS